MSEKDTKRELTPETKEKTEIENLVENFEIRAVSSSEFIKVEKATVDYSENSPLDEKNEDIVRLKFESTKPDDIDLSENEIDYLMERSPVFKELAEPKLPALPNENRARLQMQSPNRLYFYWSIKNNPFQTLNRAFGESAGNYTLAVKLVNQTKKREEIIPIETQGATWFDAEADSTYRAEIGFYALNRPFTRLMFSNSVETPRKNPSPRSDYSLDWTVSANQFAHVLDASGYAQDAVEVALAGDDFEFADKAARVAFSQIFDNRQNDFIEHDAGEIRFVLLALASGYSPENLRGQISKNLLAKLLETKENLSAEKVRIALQENFGEFADQTLTEEFGRTVFGASSLNFPRFSKRHVLPKFTTVSSF